jgi:hypothetical protein
MLQPRNPNLIVTQEMLDLFERGMRLVEQGHAEIDDDHVTGCLECQEYRGISKRLCWTLIGLEPHCASVFDPAVDGPPPDMDSIYFKRRDWPLVQTWRRALIDALRERGCNAES